MLSDKKKFSQKKSCIVHQLHKFFQHVQHTHNPNTELLTQSPVQSHLKKYVHKSISCVKISPNAKVLKMSTPSLLVQDFPNSTRPSFVWQD